MRKHFVLAIALLAIGGLLKAAEGVTPLEEVKALNFGIISTESQINLRKDWEPFIADMEKKLGMPVKAFYAPDYAGVIEAMRFGKVHVAWYGNKSAMEAVDRSNAEVFVQTVDVNGNPGYWSLLIVHKDSEIKSLEDILKNPGKYTFGNGDPNSTSGYLVPAYYVFGLNKIDPKTHFKVVTNANHEGNALAVANKKVDVATNNTENMDKIKEKFPDQYPNIREIWRSPLIASDPICWRKDLPDEIKAKLKKFFLEYGKNADAAEKDRELAIIKKLGWAPFRESSNAQLIPIRKLALFKDRMKVESDTTISAEEKQKKLADFDAKLAALDKEHAHN